MLPLLAPPLCWSCAATARRGEPLCLTCLGNLRRLPPEPIDVSGLTAWAAVAYEGPARDLVRALKFRGALAVADTMAAQIAACAPPALLAEGAVLIPVPLHRARLRRRGFNQARAIAEALGARTGLAVADCLVRTTATPPQVGRDRRERLEALAGTVRAGGVQPARALLVDDVFTTGATLAACAAALGSSRSVCALAYARTPGR